MPQPHSVMIHEFQAWGTPSFDDEGDQRIGFYYQFTDLLEQPIGGLIGPYRDSEDVEAAASRAFRRRDF